MFMSEALALDSKSQGLETFHVAHPFLYKMLIFQLLV